VMLQRSQAVHEAQRLCSCVLSQCLITAWQTFDASCVMNCTSIALDPSIQVRENRLCECRDLCKKLHIRLLQRVERNTSDGWLARQWSWRVVDTGLNWLGGAGPCRSRLSCPSRLRLRIQLVEIKNPIYCPRGLWC